MSHLVFQNEALKMRGMKEIKIFKYSFFEFYSFLFILVILSGCCCPNKYQPKWDSPPVPPCCVPEKIRVALVLGGGGVKGVAHVGVLEELECANIPIDLIVGCSAG